MSRLEILDGAAATQVEKVGASASISGAAALTLGQVGEAMFDTNALSQLLSALGCGHQFSESVLQAFVLGDGHRASGCSRHRALGAKPASVASFRLKLDDGSGCEMFGLP